MGFFAPDEVAIKKSRSNAAQRADLDSQARGCEGCSLKENWSWIATPCMPCSGAMSDGDILVLGEAPEEEEDKHGAAFVGAYGAMLRRVIPGRELDRLIFQNTVRCRTRNDVVPSIRNSHACSLFLEEDIERLNIKAILGVGAVPLARFFPGAQISKVHGTRFPVRVGSKMLWYYPILHPSYVAKTGGEPDRRGYGSAAFPVLKSDVKTFFRDIDKWRTPTIWEPDPNDVLMPGTEEEAREILSAMDPGALGIDIETQKLRPFLKGAKLLTASISDKDVSMAFPIEHPEAPNNWGLRLLLEVASTRLWVAHNAAFELLWMLYKAEEADIEFVPFAYEDSMACARLYHARESILSLADVTRIHLGVNIKMVHTVNINNMEAEPLSRVLPYNGLDAQSCLKAFHKMRRHIKTENYDRFVESTHSTARMELIGLDADMEENARLKERWQKQLDETAARARQLYEVKAFEREKQIEFNIGSPAHVGIALVEFGKVDLPKTSKKNDNRETIEGDQYSTDDQVLREKCPDNPLAKITIEWRESNKQIGTYIDAVVRHIEDSADGWLHPSYTTMLTATTRLSSADPNIQNFPQRRHRELRKQVIPDRIPYWDREARRDYLKHIAKERGVPSGKHGKHVFLKADYGQGEVRVYACLTRDPVLVSSTIEGEDIHSYWRDRALAVHPPYLDRLKDRTNSQDMAVVMKGARDVMKSDFVFASFFGSIAKSVSDRTGIPLKKAEELLAEFWKRYNVAHTWLQKQRQLYADTGSVFTIGGVERHGILWGNETINTPIQGGLAHLVLDAQNELSRLSIELNEPYLHPRINIHDDVTFVLPYDLDLIAAYMQDVIGPALVRLRHDWQIVPFAAEFSFGEDWMNFEKLDTIVGDYHR